MLIKNGYLHLFIAYGSVNWHLDQTLTVCAYKIFIPFFHTTLWSHTALKLKLEAKYAFSSFALHWTCLTFEWLACVWFIYWLRLYIFFFGVVVFSIFIIFCTAVNDSTEQALRNKKEACTVTDTVTSVKGIPCAYK